MSAFHARLYPGPTMEIDEEPRHGDDPVVHL